MVKNKADYSPQRVGELPKSAQEWMQKFHASLNNQNKFAHQLSPPLYQQLNEAIPCINNDVQTFRDWHYLVHPDSSVAGLNIDNLIFLLIIRKDIFTVDELEKCLQTDVLPIKAPYISPHKSREIVQTIRLALNQWHQEQNTSSQ